MHYVSQSLITQNELWLSLENKLLFLVNRDEKHISISDKISNPSVKVTCIIRPKTNKNYSASILTSEF